MKMLSALAAVAILPACLLAAVPESFETDVLPTSQGDLRLTFNRSLVNETVALDGVSLDIDRGQFVVLLGDYRLTLAQLQEQRFSDVKPALRSIAVGSDAKRHVVTPPSSFGTSR